MADLDYKSGLPIRSEADGADERVHIKIYGNSTGSGAATNEAIVDNDKNLHIEVHGNNPAGADTTLRLSELGAVNSDGDYDAVNNTKPASVGIIVHDRTATPTESNQNFRVTGKQGTLDNSVHALDIALHDENGNAFSDSNPLPVSVVDSEGQEINDHNASTTAVASNASDTHVYTATEDIKLTQVVMSASSKAKFDVEIDATNSGTYTRKFVFFNSTANPNIIFQLKEAIQISSGGKVRITRKNLDNQSQTLYSTICGHTIV
jgi:hypothetical protein